MGKLKILFIKNRCEKIARHKKRRKNHKRKRRSSNIVLQRSQITFKKNNFYEKNNSNVINIPSDFSMIDNPDESILTLKKINYLFEKSRTNSIAMDYSKCKRLGLEASVLTDLIELNGFVWLMCATQNG